MNEKKRKTTAVKFALSLITDEGRVFAVAAGENFLKLSPKRKEKWKKMTEEEEKEKKNSMNEKENEIPLHPTVLEWRICPAGCQETASSFDFRRFSGAEFSQRISSPHVRFLSPRGTRVQEPTRARVRWSWLASSWLVVLPLIVCSFYFGCRFCQLQLLARVTLRTPWRK